MAEQKGNRDRDIELFCRVFSKEFSANPVPECLGPREVLDLRMIAHWSRKGLLSSTR